MTSRQLAAYKRLCAEMGRRGGKAAAASMTPEQRQTRAQKAGQARWAKARAAEPPEKP